MIPTDDSPECVLVGNLGEGFTYERLDAAFRHLMAGADLIAFSKNRNWQTAGGEFSLDAGPFVAARRVHGRCVRLADGRVTGDLAQRSPFQRELDHALLGGERYPQLVAPEVYGYPIR